MCALIACSVLLGVIHTEDHENISMQEKDACGANRNHFFSTLVMVEV